MIALRRLVAALAACLSLGAVLVSCNSGGDDAPSGNSTVTGSVSGFTGSIRVRGTGLRANATNGGIFVISGVPAGSQVLDFTQSNAAAGLAGGNTASLTVNVPDSSTVNLGTVKVDDSSVRASKVSVTKNAGAVKGNGNSSNGNDDDNGNDDNGKDDNGNDDKGKDDNGNDDKGKDDNGKDDDNGNSGKNK